MNRQIITKAGKLVLSAALQERKPVSLSCYGETDSLLNHIYIGKVRDVVPYLNAAFVYISPEIKGYLDLKHAAHCIYISPKRSSMLCQGDEILVQVTKDAIKTKDPVLSCNLQISNKYVVLTYGKNFLGFSNKITDTQWKEAVREIAEPYITEDIGFIIRTNCRQLEPEEVLLQIQKLTEQFEQLKQQAMHRKCYYQVYAEPAGYIMDIRNSYTQDMEEIITDQTQIYDTLKQYLETEQPEDLHKLRFYQDDHYPLMKCYNLEGIYKSAVMPKVWLKSGAYLIIEPTEALTVIDVNTGKFQSKKKDNDSVFYKINMEAAEEIARQLRIRNISGIVIIDFINMSDGYTQKLADELLRIFKADPIPVHLAGFTSLGLVELTRKKTKASLYAWKQDILRLGALTDEEV